MSIQWRAAKAPVRQNLVKNYRPIGPAAIAAAVLAMKHRRAGPRMIARRAANPR
jgi:hypothetical protein